MRRITRALLARHPLPELDSDDDKEARGSILVIGGCTRVPGAMRLAGVAALRAGAGKLQLATVRDAAIPLGIAVPECLALALPSTEAGDIAASGDHAAACADALRVHVPGARAVLVGPGALHADETRALLGIIVPMLSSHSALVLDGMAVVALRDHEAMLAGVGERTVLTPHSGEMASMLDVDRRDVERDPQESAQLAADRWGVTVVLKGAETFIASPGDECLHFDGGSVGLGTSGSGDTLAGIMAGLAARGATVSVAAMWAVWAHATAGRQLARRMAPVGFLARELLAEIPALVGGR